MAAQARARVEFSSGLALLGYRALKVISEVGIQSASLSPNPRIVERRCVRIPASEIT